MKMLVTAARPLPATSALAACSMGGERRRAGRDALILAADVQQRGPARYRPSRDGYIEALGDPRSLKSSASSIRRLAITFIACRASRPSWFPGYECTTRDRGPVRSGCARAAPRVGSTR